VSHHPRPDAEPCQVLRRIRLREGGHTRMDCQSEEDQPHDKSPPERPHPDTAARATVENSHSDERKT